MSGLLCAPPWVRCQHEAAALKWSFVPPDRLSVWCRSCNQVWDETTVPTDIMEALVALLDAGRYTIVPSRAST